MYVGMDHYPLEISCSFALLQLLKAQLPTYITKLCWMANNNLHLGEH
jgi:hypothetical protein